MTIRSSDEFYKSIKMAPTLYVTDVSPPVRAVLMTAKAINLELEHKRLKLDGDHMNEEFIKINPQHTVPTLIDNGLILWDSHAIMTYLINKYAKGHPLYPEDPVKRAKIDQRLHFDTGVTFPVLIGTAKPIRMRLTKEIPKEKFAAANEAYGFLEKFLEGQDYVAGNELSLADISLVTNVTTLASFFPVDNYPNIVNWIKRCEKLPYYSIHRECLEKGKALFDELLK